jgi:hypothetical protein
MNALLEKTVLLAPLLATVPVAAVPAHSHLWYDCATVLCVALAALAVLACIYLAFQIWEKQRIIAHYRREEQARARRVSTKRGAYRGRAVSGGTPETTGGTPVPPKEIS